MAFRFSQPLAQIRADRDHPALVGNVPSIIAYGNAHRWQINNGNVIASPTVTGTMNGVATPIGTGFSFDGSSNYLTYPAANIPTQEFTLLWGGVFTSIASFRGLVDCVSGSNGWTVFQSGSDTLYFSINSYGGTTNHAGWTAGKFWHGAIRFKTGVEHAWFRNGEKLSTTVPVVTPGTTIADLRVGNHYAGGTSLLLGSLAYFYLIAKWLDDSIIIRLQQNPWQLLEEDPEVLYWPPASAPPAGTVIPVFANHYRNMGIM